MYTRFALIYKHPLSFVSNLVKGCISSPVKILHFLIRRSPSSIIYLFMILSRGGVLVLGFVSVLTLARPVDTHRVLALLLSFELGGPTRKEDLIHSSHESRLYGIPGPILLPREIAISRPHFRGQATRPAWLGLGPFSFYNLKHGLTPHGILLCLCYFICSFFF